MVFAQTAGWADTLPELTKEKLIMAEENQGNQGGAGTTDAQAKIESSKTHARRAAEDLKSAASEIAGEYRGKAEQAWGEYRAKLSKPGATRRTTRARTFQEDGEAYVRENPTKAVFTALGIGFVLGMIFRK